MRPGHRAALIGSALAMACGALAVAGAAGAAPVPETGSSGLLWLEADPYPAENLSILPGERLLWPVTAELAAPTSGQLTLEVSAAEPLAEDARALRFALASCPEPWVVSSDHSAAASCAGGVGEQLISEMPFATAASDAQTWHLGLIAPGVPRYFLVTLSLPATLPGDLATEVAEIGFGFSARDDDVTTRLAQTGAVLIGPVLLGLGLLGGGFTVARIRFAEASA